MMRPLAAMLLPLSASVALAACGGDDKDTATTTAATRAIRPAPKSAADLARAKRAVLVTSDLPAGWTASADDDTSDPSPCAAVRDARAAATARTTSRDFDHEPSGQITQTVYVFADDGSARRTYAAITSDDTRTCLAAGLEKVLTANPGQGVRIGGVTTSRLVINPVGDQSGAIHLVVDFTASGQRAALGTDVVFVREGRGVSVLTALDERGAVDEQLRTALTATVDRKLRAALGAQ